MIDIPLEIGAKEYPDIHTLGMGTERVGYICVQKYANFSPEEPLWKHELDRKLLGFQFLSYLFFTLPASSGFPGL